MTLKVLSAAEWRVFSVLSRQGPMRVKDILPELADSSGTPAYTTVLTLLQRMVVKGYVKGESCRSRGRMDFLGSPATVYATCVSYEKALRLIVAHFLDSFHPWDLDALKRIVDERLSQSGPRPPARTPLLDLVRRLLQQVRPTTRHRERYWESLPR